jgi:hypothetical protein
MAGQNTVLHMFELVTPSHHDYATVECQSRYVNTSTPLEGRQQTAATRSCCAPFGAGLLLVACPAAAGVR